MKLTNIAALVLAVPLSLNAAAVETKDAKCDKIVSGVVEAVKQLEKIAEDGKGIGLIVPLQNVTEETQTCIARGIDAKTGMRYKIQKYFDRINPNKIYLRLTSEGQYQ